jgi:hypothetical protein
MSVWSSEIANHEVRIQRRFRRSRIATLLPCCLRLLWPDNQPPVAISLAVLGLLD